MSNIKVQTNKKKKRILSATIRQVKSLYLWQPDYKRSFTARSSTFGKGINFSTMYTKKRTMNK